MKNTLLFKSLFAILLLVSTAQASAGFIIIDAINSGWYTATSANGNRGNINTTIATQRHNWLGFDLSGVTETIVSATLEVASDSRNDFAPVFTWSEVTSAYASLGTASLAIFNDLADGPVFAQGDQTPGFINSFDLNAAAIASLNMSTSNWAIGGSRIGGGTNAFGYTSGVASGDNIKLVLITRDVPEPITFTLFGLGLAGIGFARRKKA